MKLLCRVLVTLMLCVGVSADIVPIPGTQLVAPLFTRSDIVCSCAVVATNVIREETLGSSPKQTVVRHVQDTVEVKDSFKPNALPPGERLIVERQDYARRSTKGSVSVKSVLLFLKKTESGSYVYADQYLGAIQFDALPTSPRGIGLTKLESELASVLRQNGRNDQVKAMRLLGGFRLIGPDTLAVLNSLTNSPDQEMALSSIAVLIRTNTPGSIGVLKNYLEAYGGDVHAEALLSIGTFLAQMRDPAELPSLEALSGSKEPSVKFGATSALRSIKSPSSGPALIERLDEANSGVRYIAVMGLAEIFGKDKDYAPSMKKFNEDPEKYVALWKDWWSQTGRNMADPQRNGNRRP